MKKASDLLRLALMLAASRTGVTREEARAAFGWKTVRSAQRYLHELEILFTDCETFTDHDGHKRWRLDGRHFRELLNVTADEMATFDLAIDRLRRDGMEAEAKLLTGLGDKVRSLIPRVKVTRIETDQEALLEAQGFVARPGPRPRSDDAAIATIIEAIKACKMIEFEYRSQSDGRRRHRRVAPLGLLSGFRRYLVAASPKGSNASPKSFRLDSMGGVKLIDTSFERPENFDLRSFANRAFGVFQNDAEFDDVVWRFLPKVASQARGHLFHPSQTTEDSEDGSLIVSFRAAGLLEMCWYLYAWGDGVEVVKPEKLRAMTKDFRRGDFQSTP